MKLRKDFTGLRFGRLLVLGIGEEYHDKGNHLRRKWMCKCDCGRTKNILEGALLNGKTVSCGCYKMEVNKQTKIETLHGKSSTKLYYTWKHMRQRCNDPSNYAYKDYGGRGISVCPEWNGTDSFMRFYEWAISSGYKEDLTIDRINVNGDYSPDNCRWVTRSEQQRNKRNTKYVTYKGETKCLAIWTDELNLPYKTIYSRFRNGWGAERAFETPIRK